MGVAVGATELHEFGHAFGQLADEYIDTRGSGYEGRKPPSPTSVFSLSNLWYSNETPRSRGSTSATTLQSPDAAAELPNRSEARHQRETLTSSVSTGRPLSGCVGRALS